jgi:hypothetical protein
MIFIMVCVNLTELAMFFIMILVMEFVTDALLKNIVFFIMLFKMNFIVMIFFIMFLEMHLNIEKTLCFS